MGLNWGDYLLIIYSFGYGGSDIIENIGRITSIITAAIQTGRRFINFFLSKITLLLFGGDTYRGFLHIFTILR